MPYSLLQFFLIVSGILIILIVILRRFPQISLLDVDKLPEEQQARTKKTIMEKQFVEFLKRNKIILIKLFKPFVRFWKKIQSRFRDTITKTYLRYAKTRARIKENKDYETPPPEAIAALLKDAETALLTEQYNDAEQKYIEIIRIMPRNIEAYRGLARLYFEQKQWKEAEEMYLFILRFDPNDGRALNRLGMISMERERWNDAVRYFKRVVDVDPNVAIRQFDLGNAYVEIGKHINALRAYEKAVALESLNPKYLDAYLEEAIIVGNKHLALAIFDQLKLANPENKKLEDFRRRVDGMEEIKFKKNLHKKEEP